MDNVNEYKLSIIVPVYNSEKSIKRTIDSIVSQLVGRTEIILVDDGSTDSSYEICSAYARQYENIKVISQENRGVSAARNAGIMASSGEYITFIDSDDYYSNSFIQSVFGVIDDYLPDLIYFGWQYVTDGVVMPGRIANIPKDIILDRKYIKEIIIPPLINIRNDPEHFIDDFACNKVYRRQVLLQNNVYFNDSRRIWEDRPFVVSALKHVENMFCMDGFFLNYVNTEGSLSRRFYLEMLEIIVDNYNLYSGLFSGEYDFDTEYVYGYWSHSIENMILRSLKEKELKGEIHQNIIRTLDNEVVRNWFCHRTSKSKFDNRINELLEKKEYEKIIHCYRIINLKNMCSHTIDGIKMRLRNVVFKMRRWSNGG